MSKEKVLDQIKRIPLPLADSTSEESLQLYLFKDGRYEACYDPVTSIEILEHSINIRNGHYGMLGNEQIWNHSYDSFDHIELLPKNWLEDKSLDFVYDSAQ